MVLDASETLFPNTMHLTTATDENRRPERASSPPGKAGYVAAIAAAMGLICWLDLVTGSAPVQHLYYIPIVVAAIRLGLWPGIAASAAAIILYHIGGELRQARYSEADLIKITLFVGIGVIAARLAEDKRRFHRLAMTDDLTGLANLRCFEARLHETITRLRQFGGPLSMVVIDLDRLKQLNDRHGHLAGAEAVRTVGHIIGKRLPPDAVACRYGGDEFAVALPDYDATTAARWAEDVRVAVQTSTPFLLGRSWPQGTLSVSAGAACAHPSDADPAISVDRQGEALFHSADVAMYEAKTGGRNRTVASPAARSRAAADQGLGRPN